jgi:hypothetical protein
LQIRKQAAQSMLLELRLKARAARFVPVTLKMQNNRLFTLSRISENALGDKNK